MILIKALFAFVKILLYKNSTNGRKVQCSEFTDDSVHKRKKRKVSIWLELFFNSLLKIKLKRLEDSPSP